MEPVPRAYPPLPARGVMRRCPEDFEVDERLDLTLTGSGEHLYLKVEKRGVNTAAVAQALADAAGVPVADVGYAGMKDRRAVARQWFSVPTPQTCLAPGAALDARVVARTRHARKLRRGQLSANRFRIVLRDVDGARDAIDDRLGTIRDQGVPNYFGPQRFGRDGANLDAAWEWLSHRPRRRLSRYRQGILLSAARALLFNAVLAERVRRGIWDEVVDGDVVEDGAVTGPLWGRGRSPATGVSATVEGAALEPHGEWLVPLEHVGLTQQRRPLIARPVDLTWCWQPAVLELSFALAKGCYATSLIAELGDFPDAGEVRRG